jgi:ethanolaminephosphotransferase
MIWRVIKYADESKLHHLLAYTYHGEDHSLLANYVFQPFWRWAAEFLPLWLAPNLITLLGLLAMVLGYAVVAFHLPELQVRCCSRRVFFFFFFFFFDGFFFFFFFFFFFSKLEVGESEPPSWVWLLCGACIFTYQTLDALDGKQARRTGTSSPLGELVQQSLDVCLLLCSIAALLLLCLA